MSFADDTVFNCVYGGKFETHNGVLCYVGGETLVVETQPQALFTTLSASLNLYGKRVYYKLPFEDLSDLKLLCNGSGNFERMCSTAIWVRGIDIYLEDEKVTEEDADGDENVAQETADGDGNVAEEEDGNNGEVNNEGSDDDHDICEEEARVEAIVADFVDEEENENYQDTPDNSDCEEEPAERQTERYRRGSGNLKLMQVFDSIKEFKEAVVEYVLKEGWNVKYTRWGSDISEVKCVVEDDDCKWRLYCSFEEPLGKYMIKTYEDDHTCIKDGRSKVITQEVIAQLFVNDVRKDPNFRPRDMQAQIEERYNVIVTDDQCRKAKKRAFDIIQEEHDEQFRRMKDYMLEILNSNPGTSVGLVTLPGEDGKERFESFYVCFEALRRIWIARGLSLGLMDVS